MDLLQVTVERMLTGSLNLSTIYANEFIRQAYFEYEEDEAILVFLECVEERTGTPRKRFSCFELANKSERSKTWIVGLSTDSKREALKWFEEQEKICRVLNDEAELIAEKPKILSGPVKW